MLFDALARDAQGRELKLRREAPDASALAARLRAEDLLVLDASPVRAPAAARVRRTTPAGLLPVTKFDVETGLRQISSMLRSGVTLPAALATAAEQSEKPRAAALWLELRDGVFAGRPLADAMDSRRRAFGTLAAELVRVGERSGELAGALAHAADEMEAARSLRSLVAGALLYPCLAVAMTLAVTAFLTLAVIPKISEFLRSGGAELPAMTQSLMDFSEWLSARGAALLAALGAAAAALLAARAVPAARERLDAAALRVPVSGRILRLSGTALFARAMSVLVGSGVTLLDSLAVAGRLLSNRRLARRVREARDAVLAGEPLAPALRSRGEWIPMLGGMAAVGESTGALPESFAETARFSETLLASVIKRFSVLIEPALIIVTAAVVGYVYISFFLALFAMAGVN